MIADARPPVSSCGHGRIRALRPWKGQPTDRITFRTDDGLTLEGEIRAPQGEPRASAVICHPHPQHGGSKDHPLLWAIRNSLASSGFAVLSFNFRGVMGSSGVYGSGVTELADVRAAITRARQESDLATFVCGWSFGAHLALREALEDERPDALALVGFPLSESSFVLPPLPDRVRLKAYDKPVLFVTGEADPLCPIQDVKALARRLGNADVRVVPGTDHFFWKREREAAEIVRRFATERLVATGA